MPNVTKKIEIKGKIYTPYTSKFNIITDVNEAFQNQYQNGFPFWYWLRGLLLSKFSKN